MARIAGVDIPREKRIEAALPYVFGIGPSLSRAILKEAGVSPDLRTRDLAEEQLTKIREIIEKKYTVEGALKHRIDLNIKRLKDIQSYRGLRHVRGLPVRGQRTITNARTRKGRRTSIGTKKS